MSEPVAPKKSAARGRWSSKTVLIALTVLAGGLGLLSSVQVWIEIGFFDGVAATPSLEATGQKLHPSITLISLAGIAAALVLTIAGRVFRLAIGGLIAVLGAGLAIIGILALISPAEDAALAVSEVTGITGDGQYALIETANVTVWPIIAVVAGCLFAVAGIGVLVFGRGWAKSGRKYEAASDSTTARQTRGAGAPDRISDWDALSDGDDPTDDASNDESPRDPAK